MKRFLPILAALMIGCASTPAPKPVEQVAPPAATEPAPPPVAPEPEPTYVARGTWSIQLPPRWVFNDVQEREGDLTRELEARSTYDVGRGPMHLTVSTIPFDGPEVAFAQIASMHAGELVHGSQVLGRRMVMIGERPASLTVLLTKSLVEVAVVALADGEKGYVIACGGDIKRHSDSRQVAETCATTVKTFRVKKQ